MRLAKKQQYLIMGALLIVVLFFITQVPMLSLVGASTLSCTEPKFISSDEFYGNGTFQCTMAATGSGKYLETILSPEDALRLFGVLTDEPAKITVELLKDDCKYEIENQSYPIYQYNVRPKDITTSSSCGCYVCMASMANPSYDSAQMEKTYGDYIGTTPISCRSSGCPTSGGAGVVTGGCDSVWKKQIGVVHRLSPSVIYDFEMRINMSMGSNIYSATITQQNASVFTPGFRAELLGQLQGQQSCPSNPDMVVFVSNTPTTNPLSLKPKFSADTLIQNGQIYNDIYAITGIYQSHNALLSSFVSSSASAGQYCEVSSPNLQGAYVSCNPTGTVSIPIFNLYINAEEIGVHVPSGKPEILQVSASKAESAEKSTVAVKTLNSGEADSFDASVKCAYDINPFSSRSYLAEGETKDIEVVYQGAGFIDTCTIDVRSVNSPQNSDSETKKLIFYPFCARQQPSPYHDKVFTSKGCAFVCPDYGKADASDNLIDVFDSSCNRMNPTSSISDYDRCTYSDIDQSCISKAFYGGIHCVDIGKYMTTNRYMDKVAEGQMQPFIPAQQPHKYFVVSIDNTPICDYIDEYGYSNGAEVASLVFDYTQGYPEASEESYLSANQVPEQPTSESPLKNPFIVIGSIVILGGIVYLLTKKRRGGK